MENKKVLVRGDRSGVHFGVLEKREGHEVTLANARRVYYWDGACGLDELSTNGTSKPNNCKFTVSVEKILILDAIEIYPLTEKAIGNLEAVKVWKF